MENNQTFAEDIQTPVETATTEIVIEEEKPQIETELTEKLLQKIDKIESSIQDFTYKDEINNRLRDELQKYKSGLRKEFITPLLKGIIREYDRAMRQHKIYSQKAQETNQSEEYANLLKQFEMMSFALLDLLSDYDIESFEVKEGNPYSAKEHRIVEVVETSDADKDNTIASCVACGFRDISNERLMRHAEVNVYKQK